MFILFMQQCAEGLSYFRDGLFSVGVAVGSCLYPNNLIWDPVSSDLFQACLFGDEGAVSRIHGRKVTQLLDPADCDSATMLAIDQPTSSIIVGCASNGVIRRAINGTGSVSTLLPKTLCKQL